MLRVENVTKVYGGKKVVNNLSFNLKKGEVLGFLGPNGAGKSTTMNMITGYIGASSGRILIDGKDSIDNADEVKGKIGYLPEIPPLYMDMTIEEYLKFVCQLKKVKRSDIKETIKTITEMVKIDHVRGRIINNLSKGYKQRVGIAQAIIGDPNIVIFDEPTVGLDPKEIVEIRKLIKDIGKDRTVILSSHILSEIEEVCDKILIINKGEFVAIGTKEELKKKLSSSEKLFIRIKGEKDKINSALNRVESVKNVIFETSLEDGAYDVTLEINEGNDPREEIFFELAKEYLPIIKLSKDDIGLEKIFLQITK